MYIYNIYIAINPVTIVYAAQCYFPAGPRALVSLIALFIMWRRYCHQGNNMILEGDVYSWTEKTATLIHPGNT